MGVERVRRGGRLVRLSQGSIHKPLLMVCPERW